MTEIGHKIFLIYSITIVLLLMLRSFRNIDKKGDEGWLLVILTPILILLINLD